MKVVNLFAGPGAGKSTLAAGLFYKLKLEHISCELVTEYAKELCWQGILASTPQIQIFEEQARRLERMRDKVDFLITDSPILLTQAYCQDPFLISESVKLHRSFDNLNFYIRGVKHYSPVGRDQSEVEAIMLDRTLEAILHIYDYTVVDGDSLGLEEMRGHVIASHQATTRK